MKLPRSECRTGRNNVAQSLPEFSPLSRLRRVSYHVKDQLLHYLCHGGQTRVAVLPDQWPSFGCDEVTAKKHEATRPLIIYDGGGGKENEKLTPHQGDNTFRTPAEYLPTMDTIRQLSSEFAAFVQLIYTYNVISDVYLIAHSVTIAPRFVPLYFFLVNSVIGFFSYY